MHESTHHTHYTQTTELRRVVLLVSARRRPTLSGTSLSRLPPASIHPWQSSTLTRCLPAPLSPHALTFLSVCPLAPHRQPGPSTTLVRPSRRGSCRGRHPVSPAPAPPWSDPPGGVAAGGGTLSARPQHHPGPTLPDWWLQGAAPCQSGPSTTLVRPSRSGGCRGRYPVSPAPAPPWSDPPGLVAAGGGTLSARPQHHPGPTLPEWWLQGRRVSCPLSMQRSSRHAFPDGARLTRAYRGRQSSRHTAAATTAQLAAAQRSGEPRNSAGWAADVLAGC